MQNMPKLESRAQLTLVRPLASALTDALRLWWAEENLSWEADDASECDGDLWDGMPEVDSKAVARASPVFEQILGIPLDIKLIQKGGYQGIEEMIADLVPKMDAAAQKKGSNRKD